MFPKEEVVQSWTAVQFWTVNFEQWARTIIYSALWREHAEENVEEDVEEDVEEMQG